MNPNLHQLQGSLTTGFIDQAHDSIRSFRPELLLNDKFTGKKVLTTIEQELRNCDEFFFSVAFITTSGIASLKQTLKELEDRKIPGKILASQYLNFTQPEALRWLLNFDNIELKIVTDGDFHSKGYIFRKGNFYNLIIGSSNLTASALSLNKEWNLKVTAMDASELIAQSVDSFNAEFAAATEVDATWITTYDLYYRSQMERSQIRQRIKSGYDSFRKNGGKVGRKNGFTKDKETLLNQHKDIVKYLRQGQSVRNTMKLTGKSSGTVQKIKGLIV